MIEQGLTVESGNVLIEIGKEKVQIPFPCVQSILVIFEHIVKVISCFCCDCSTLFITSCISRYEEYRDSFYLSLISMAP